MSERLPFQMLAGLLGGLALATAAHSLLAGSPAVDALVRYAVNFLDMCRTAVNVTGDLAAAVFVSRGEPIEPVAG